MNINTLKTADEVIRAANLGRIDPTTPFVVLLRHYADLRGQEMDDQCDAAIDEAYNDGCRSGYEDGAVDGWDRGWIDAIGEFEDQLFGSVVDTLLERLNLYGSDAYEKMFLGILQDAVIAAEREAATHRRKYFDELD